MKQFAFAAFLFIGCTQQAVTPATVCQQRALDDQAVLAKIAATHGETQAVMTEQFITSCTDQFSADINQIEQDLSGIAGEDAGVVGKEKK